MPGGPVGTLELIAAGSPCWVDCVGKMKEAYRDRGVVGGRGWRRGGREVGEAGEGEWGRG